MKNNIDYIGIDLVYPYIIEVNILNPGGINTMSTLGHNENADKVIDIILGSNTTWVGISQGCHERPVPLAAVRGLYISVYKQDRSYIYSKNHGDKFYKWTTEFWFILESVEVIVSS